MRRAVKPTARRLIAAGDLAILFWLLAGLPLSLLPCRLRWGLCRALAIPALLGVRAQAASQALRRMANVEDAVARSIVRQVYAGRLASQLDLLHGLLAGPDLVYECRGIERLDAALDEGRGAVLWISDFVGAGDAVKVALARYGVSHLSRPEHGFSKTRFAIRFLNPIRILFERTYLKERLVYDRGSPKRALGRLLACLAENGVVSITASTHEGRQLAEGRLLEGHLRLAIGAPKAALLSGAALIPVHAIRNRSDPRRFEIILGPPLPLSRDLPATEAILAATGAYLEGLEELVSRRPEAWGSWRRLGTLA
ncbi:MAG TPA: hypothetical protein VN821_14370 [Candidatus Udaeobacter sp.]|nr:hypothetical protein [Candidatus Udaeobacter sp.]